MESSIPYFKAALKTRLEADATLTGLKVSVSRGHPHPNMWPLKGIIIGAVSNWSLQFTSALTQANEVYDLEVIVNYAGTAQNAYSTYEDGAYAIMVAVLASVVSWMDGNPLTSGAWGSVNAAVPQPGGDAEGLDEDGKMRDSTVTMQLHVTARLI